MGHPERVIEKGVLQQSGLAYITFILALLFISQCILCGLICTVCPLLTSIQLSEMVLGALNQNLVQFTLRPGVQITVYAAHLSAGEVHINVSHIVIRSTKERTIQAGQKETSDQVHA